MMKIEPTRRQLLRALCLGGAAAATTSLVGCGGEAQRAAPARLLPGCCRCSDRRPSPSWSLCSGSGSSAATSRAASGSWIPPPSISIPGFRWAGGLFCCPAPFCGARPPSAATVRSAPRLWWTAAGSVTAWSSTPPKSPAVPWVTDATWDPTPTCVQAVMWDKCHVGAFVQLKNCHLARAPR